MHQKKAFGYIKIEKYDVGNENIDQGLKMLLINFREFKA